MAAGSHEAQVTQAEVSLRLLLVSLLCLSLTNSPGKVR